MCLGGAREAAIYTASGAAAEEKKELVWCTTFPGYKIGWLLNLCAVECIPGYESGTSLFLLKLG